MENARYLWRQLTPKQREEIVVWRKERKRPLHSPPHVRVPHTCFHLSAACYEHQPWIGMTPERIDSFSVNFVALLSEITTRVYAWCVLPNHYHALVSTPDNLALIAAIGKFHGRTSLTWNREDKSPGRKVFFRSIDKPVRSDRHFWATMNYIHHNPVHHRYAVDWHEWPWSSAAAYLQATGESEARRIWQEYPVLGMGRNWDEPEI